MPQGQGVLMMLHIDDRGDLELGCTERARAGAGFRERLCEMERPRHKDRMI
jgi:hypothetical protein